MINRQVVDLLQHSEHLLATAKPRNIDEVRKHGTPLIAFSESMEAAHRALKQFLHEQLYRQCDLTVFDFETTATLQDIDETLGQQRALQAIHFGVGIQQPGYNLYVLGRRGMGKHTTVETYLKEIAAQQGAPSDWCYVHNFTQPHKPCYLELPAGRGTALQHDMQQLIEDLHSVIPAAFEADEYHARLHDIEEGLKEQAETQFNELAKQAEIHHITLLRTPHGFAFAPQKDDKVVSPEEYDKLPDKEKDRLEQIMPAEKKVDQDWSFSAYRWMNSQLQGIPDYHVVNTADLLYIDRQADILSKNTRQFIKGHPANNALLWGARGTGKSSMSNPQPAAIIGSLRAIPRTSSGSRTCLVLPVYTDPVTKSCRESSFS